MGDSSTIWACLKDPWSPELGSEAELLRMVRAKLSFSDKSAYEYLRGFMFSPKAWVISLFKIGIFVLDYISLDHRTGMGGV